MTDRGRGWIERLAGDSLRSQYRLAVVVVLSSLVLTSVISALSVIWANDVLQEQSERATTLKGVNASIRLDMADAETSLRGFGISGRRSALEMYIFAMGWLPQDQTRLRTLAAGRPLTRAEQSRVALMSSSGGEDRTVVDDLLQVYGWSADGADVIGTCKKSPSANWTARIA